ncbi:Na+/H+ antiporter subunit E [Oceanobacillus iheyensis]|uniref:Na(+):H(+) antiporter n=1 Tax=Oceanobacillus iheyensis (strain DSM 14371 / CIP 107618 / JCM 11309 / KCTC 3954 / HTE831) TaxID=221109 RepID=Q8ELV9_OCEIH|nr:Na+/H+ antiporter subunit E [Oceanobacillus iheyensis]BAC15061.1 Na(+):H(+) antiporter [Oceanobacillus iheyensis HTE831]
MPAQFLLNVFIAVLWTLISDEDELRFTTFVAGYLVGIAIVFLMHRFFGERFYLARFFALIKLIFIYIRELVLSTKLVLGHILSPKIKIKPGLFKYETVLRGDWEITALALLLMLTPGSVVIEVTQEGDAFYIHAMDVEESKDMLLRSLNKFEKAIMGVTR